MGLSPHDVTVTDGVEVRIKRSTAPVCPERGCVAIDVTKPQKENDAPAR